MGKRLRSSEPLPWWIWAIWVVGPIETFFFMAMTWVAVTVLWSAVWLTALLVALRWWRRSQRREVIEWPPPAKPSRPAVKAAPRRELAGPVSRQLPTVPYRRAVDLVESTVDSSEPIRLGPVVQGKPIRNRH